MPIGHHHSSIGFFHGVEHHPADWNFLIDSIDVQVPDLWVLVVGMGHVIQFPFPTFTNENPVNHL